YPSDEIDPEHHHAALDGEVLENYRCDSARGHEAGQPEGDLRGHHREEGAEQGQPEGDDDDHRLRLPREEARGELEAVEEADGRHEEPVESSAEDEEEEAHEDTA